MSFFNSQKQSM